jgi:hypothetical protein
MSRVVLATLCALLLAFAAPARAEGPVTFVEDRAILTKLEEKGYGFEMLFGSEQGPDLASLYANAPAYHAIVDLISSDIAALRAEMEAAGRPTYEKTALEKGRAFDVRWLQTDAARFRLVGVINRLDRRDFNAAKGEGGCGEVRFIYRLAYSFDYDKRTLASRMPFNFNAVFTAAPDADGACTGVAGRWTPQLDEKRRCRLAGWRCARQGRAHPQAA